MNQRWFFWNNFFSKKICLFGISEDTRSAQYFCWISGLGEAQQAFLKLDLKNLIQKLRGGTNSPCLLRLQTRKFLCRKITARFKLNLKTDGPDCKMIFKSGKHVERIHSARKQCVCLYKHHLRCKMLVGDTQTLELHLKDAGCFKQIKRENCFISCGILHTATLPMPT